MTRHKTLPFPFQSPKSFYDIGTGEETLKLRPEWAKEMNMGHTPTPWPEAKYDNDLNPGFSEWWEIDGVASFHNKEDAEFALECVNSHASLVEEVERLREVIRVTRSLVSEAAMTGFRWGDGDWADRLFENQRELSKALEKPNA